MVVVNFFGGPCCGKTTLAAGAFAKLKRMGVNCEMAPEFAKQKAWENNLKAFDDHVYLLGNQSYALSVLDGEVDACLTDAPLLLCAAYNKDAFISRELWDLARKLFLKWDNLNYFVQRASSDYICSGRVHTLEESLDFDSAVRKMLEDNGIPFAPVRPDEAGTEKVVSDVCEYVFFKRRAKSACL